MPMTGEPRAKGLNFRTFMKSLDRVHGYAIVARTLEGLAPEVRDPLKYGKIVPGGWYPLEWYRLLHASAQQATARGPELSRDLARSSMHDDFSGIYRLITFVIAPQTLIKKAPQIMKLYYSHGNVEIPRAQAGMARAVFTDCQGFDKNLWEDAIGSCVGVLEACRAKEVRTEIVEGGQDGDEGLVLDARWK